MQVLHAAQAAATSAHALVSSAHGPPPRAPAHLLRMRDVGLHQDDARVAADGVLQQARLRQQPALRRAAAAGLLVEPAWGQASTVSALRGGCGEPGAPRTPRCARMQLLARCRLHACGAALTAA